MNVYKCGKTISVCCIKTREREKGGERDRLEAGKDFPVALNSL